ncbi:MAG: class I SAM-dependent methyltransferase [Planctomycetota bacterium]
MSPSLPAMILDVEARNDAFALEHDIDEYYERSNIFIRCIEAHRLRCIARMAHACPPDRILEVGCGGGHILRLFPHSRLTGVDVSGRMLEKARKNLAGYQVQLLKGELQHLNLPNGGFDKIICSEVLEHVIDPDAVLAQIRRLLAPHGRVVITLPNDDLIHRMKNLLRRTGANRLPFCGRIAWGGDDYHLHLWRIPEMRALLARFFAIQEESFVPGRWLPVRCCFQCAADGSG